MKPAYERTEKIGKSTFGTWHCIGHINQAPYEMLKLTNVLTRNVEQVIDRVWSMYIHYSDGVT